MDAAVERMWTGPPRTGLVVRRKFREEVLVEILITRGMLKELREFSTPYDQIFLIKYELLIGLWLLFVMFESITLMIGTNKENFLFND